jgi:6-phosphogluconolactonase
MDTIIKISQSPAELAKDFAGEIAGMINESAGRKRIMTVALSGGSTPKLMFSVLADGFSDSVQWEWAHFFWGDERCVPPDDPESNFRMTKEALFDTIKINESNIHRIRGEDDPQTEAERYSEEISCHVREKNGLPVFDLIILGLGDDGHTASIFPGNSILFKSDKICVPAQHPVSMQKRITVTGPVINNADKIVFLVTGSAKADIVSEIIENRGLKDYPAASVEPSHGILKWYLDIDSSSMLSQWA